MKNIFLLLLSIFAINTAYASTVNLPSPISGAATTKNDVAHSEWEIIVKGSDNELTSRLPVFGGWIVQESNFGYAVESTVFVPDAKHEWVVDKDLAWESITKDSITFRLLAFGGWLVKSYSYLYSGGISSPVTSMVYVSDPRHEWVIG